MKLSLIRQYGRVNRQQQILEWLLPLPFILREDIAWHADQSDRLFQPPRNFDDRKRARRFLSWLTNTGVPVTQWLDRLGEMPPPQHSAGGVGRAYYVGQFVVKITPDRKEAEHAAAMTKIDMPQLAPIHDVAEVGEISTKSGAIRPVYAIVQDRVHTGVSKKYRVAGDAVYNYLDDNDKPIDDHERVAQEIVANYLRPIYRNDQAVVNAVGQLVKATKDIYDRTGILLQDPHGGNLAIRDRQLSFFDVGRSQRTGGSPVAIKKIA
jgi:hypothetical protein